MLTINGKHCRFHRGLLEPVGFQKTDSAFKKFVVNKFVKFTLLYFLL
jgi:hypothetical protein